MVVLCFSWGLFSSCWRLKPAVSLMTDDLELGSRQFQLKLSPHDTCSSLNRNSFCLECACYI